MSLSLDDDVSILDDQDDVVDDEEDEETAAELESDCP